MQRRPAFTRYLLNSPNQHLIGQKSETDLTGYPESCNASQSRNYLDKRVDLIRGFWRQNAAPIVSYDLWRLTLHYPRKSMANQCSLGIVLLAALACLERVVIGNSQQPRDDANDRVSALHIQSDQVTAHVSPMLYGLMTEEINHSYDGGLYGELVANRDFKEDSNAPVSWRLVENGGGKGTISIDSDQPFNNAHPRSLKLEVSQASQGQNVGIANDGYWGIPVRSHATYRASFYAKASDRFGRWCPLYWLGH